MLPLVRLEKGFGNDLEPVGRPGVNDVRADATALHPEVKPAEGRLDIHLREDRPRSLTIRFDPTCYTKSAVEFQIHPGFKLILCSSVKLQGLGSFTVADFERALLLDCNGT